MGIARRRGAKGTQARRSRTHNKHHHHHCPLTEAGVYGFFFNGDLNYGCRFVVGFSHDDIFVGRGWERGRIFERGHRAVTGGLFSVGVPPSDEPTTVASAETGKVSSSSGTRSRPENMAVG